MAKKKWYVVWEGHRPGIYETWADCQLQVKAYPNAQYKSFSSRAEAEAAFERDGRDFIGKNPDTKAKKRSLDQEGIIWNSLSVDAACSGNPGVLEYQGVDTQSGARLFHQGPFPLGTVNIGEFLAIVHGLAYLKQQGSNLPIYTDSRTAMAWLRNRQIKTSLPRNAKTEVLFGLVDRAIAWLEKNTYSNAVIKWETERWGEIPADFGRK